ncbi:MAG TPA: response regulator [Steroidobacteraceae bacterium]|jgi:signal transduction histidine kinase|nr:response regulator [Steroidobacteraceae bacterium]
MSPVPELILNVDDNDAHRYVKSRILTAAGYRVVEAATGAALRRLVAECSPDLVLLDVRLPDANGRSLCVEIKADPSTAQVVVLQTSASHADTANRVASLEAGADGYLVEPIEPEELVAHVKALLRLRRAERDRASALAQLREADRRKDEFLAMLGHELRNPLAPIRNAVEILRVSDDRSVRERAREMVGRQVQHLARLVDDLLDVSRITTRKITLKRGVVRLGALIESAVEIARPVLDAQYHEFSVVLPPDDIWLEVDSVRLAQAIGNLLNNAAKFTPPRGRIRLAAERRGGELVVTVEDNGVGIAPEIMPSVFDLFTQGERSLDRAQGGLGIGLSLVKGLVEMHGGSVTAASPGAGQGSTFTVVLPLARLEVPAAVAQARPPTPPRDPRRVLVVEDNADAAESMRLLLDGIGHQVAVANDGNAALATARSFRPDVVLLDIGLPGMDGFQVASALRALPETSRAHLIAVSGYGQDKDRARSAQAGFDLHLVKPVDPGKLAAAIDAAD